MLEYTHDCIVGRATRARGVHGSAGACAFEEVYNYRTLILQFEISTQINVPE